MHLEAQPAAQGICPAGRCFVAVRGSSTEVAAAALSGRTAAALSGWAAAALSGWAAAACAHLLTCGGVRGETPG